jgi:antitoxin component HigA of HigAB toxin-antitoxin module
MAPGRTQSKMTVEQYRWEIIEDSITGNETSVRSLVDGDEAAALISKSIGSNALSDKEMRKVLAVIRAAFEKRNIPEAAKNPVATLVLLQNMADVTEQEDLKQEIAEMRARLLAS